ncbi:MAG: S9 family peptidase [Metallibacterium scheffleri]|uniref:S9 family peptidase n=1 Tax=Metallibacterium scheffleri TaxID=993689 RepID=UPI0026EAE9EB|nr:S9 family peptidase [Metallibacterium scheffleri]MCK9367656.1 S9 family peptidase [Metallibacterium scheffleri]
MSLPSRMFTLLLGLAFAPRLAQAASVIPPPEVPAAVSARVDAILARLGAAKAFAAVAISPHARHLAWIEKTTDGARLYLANGNGSEVRAIAAPGQHKGCGVAAPGFAPDGRTLAFLSDCASGQRAQQDIVLLDVARAGAQPRQITHLDGLVHALRWAPDGRALGFLYIQGDTRRADALASTGPQVGVIGETNIEHQRVAQVAAQGGTPQLLTPAGLFAYEFDYSPHARRIAYVAAPPPGADHWWVAQLYVQPTRAVAAPRAVVNPNTVAGPLHGLQIALPRFAPDGKSIAFIGGLMSDQGATGGDVYLVSATGGAPLDLSPGIGVTPSWFAWTGAHALLVNAFAGGSSQLASLRIDAGHGRWQPLRTVHAALGDGTAMSALALAAQGDALAWIQSSFDAPPEVWTTTLRRASDGGITALAAPHAITRINAGIRSLWGKSVSLHWTNQGFHVQGWLLYPANYNPHQRYPLIVSVHGGPSWAVQPRWPGVNYGGAPLSAMGYFVLFPNPRGSFGQGERFAKAVRRDMGYGDLRDILAGVKQVEAHFPVDPRRVGITGWSYGGFMSMFAPTQTRVFRAAVAGAGLSDWLSYNGENSIDAWMKPFFGASVYDDPAVYARSSAINFIRQDKTPTLMVVGEFDAECPAPQSFEMWRGLKAMGVPTQLVVYPNEGHGFVNPAHKRDVLVRALAWFAKYLPPDAHAEHG